MKGRPRRAIGVVAAFVLLVSAMGILLGAVPLAAELGQPSPDAATLPGPIEGIEPESHGYVAPFADSNGNLYRVTESLLAEDNQPKMMKSADGGATWTEMDAAHRPGTATGSIGDLESGWLTWDAGDKVATFTWQRSHAAYASFRTSDHPTQPDTWVSDTRENVASVTGSPQYMSHTSPTDQPYEWLFYNSNGNPVYRSRSGTGSYGTQGPIDSSGGQPAATLDTDNVSHIVYVKSSQLHYMTLTSSGTLAPASTRVDRNGVSDQPIPHAAPMVYKIGGDTHVGVVFADSAGHLKFVSIVNGAAGAEETITTSPVMQNPGDTTNEGAVISLAVHGSTLHALWSDAATGNVMHASRPHNGSWSSPTVLVSAVSSAEQTHYVHGRVYSYRGSTVLGYTYDLGPNGDDDSNIFYNELDLDAQPAIPVNEAPSVSAGPDQNVVLPASASLDGTVSDDGLPESPGVVTTTWSMTSGPGTVTFGDASALDTTASFSTAGTYVLRLTADDGALSALDEVTVTVTDSGGSVNRAPSVSAGPDQSVVLPASASLDGTVSDDGLPESPGVVTTTWSMTSGPGTVTLGDSSALDTTASFSTAGAYVLRLTADDGALSAFDEVTVSVTGGSQSVTIEARVSADSDDAEQSTRTRKTALTSGDLELTTDGRTQQVVGVRFAGLQVPAGATVTSAYVQFRADEVSTGASSMAIRAEAVDNTPTYRSTSGNVTGRVTTSASVAWSPPEWTTVGAAAAAQRTPDLSALVQAVVDRAGWVPGNALALQFSGTGQRTAEAFESGASSAPLLHVEYTTG